MILGKSTFKQKTQNSNEYETDFTTFCCKIY